MLNLIKKKLVFGKYGKLPGKPSELINIALNDLRKAEKAGHVINMGTWCEYEPTNKKCTVCFAGSVMVNSLKKLDSVKNLKNTVGLDPWELEDTKSLEPHDFDAEYSALNAINDLRTGAIKDAFDTLSIAFPANLKESVKVVEYKRNRTKFKQQMKALASALAKQGY